MRPVNIRDILTYKYLSSLTASPDRKKVAFVVSQCCEAENSYTSYIYTLDLATRNLTRMTGAGKEKSVFWLDDETLLFPASRDKALEKRVAAGEPWTVYYALRLDGGEAYEYMRVPKRVKAIKPIDRDRFALIAEHNIDRTDPHALEGEARDALLKQYKEQDESYLVADELPFRHNGIGFNNGNRSRLYIFDRAGASLLAVTEETQNVDFFEVKGERIIFSAKHFYKEQPKIFQGGMSVYDISANKLCNYVDESPYRMRSCGFIGDVPVFMGSRGERYYYQENPYFYYIDEKEGKEKIFAENDDSAENAVASDLRYGPSTHTLTEGEHLYYLKTIGNHGHLMRVSLSGKFEQLTAEKGSVDDIAVCDGEIIMTAMRKDRLQELYSLKNGVEEQLTFFNEWVQEECTLSTPVEIAYENDGVALEGMVIAPVGHKAGQKAPCILDIHGGHKIAYGTVFFHEMQLWANMGYYVIYCNPRGSDGRDNDFFEITGKYGYADYSDIMKFVDVCIERYPDIDAENMGVTGGSYGGFMTNWVIGHTDRFKCAASQRGISSWATMFLNSDTSYQFPMYRPDSDIWDNVARYWEHSPVKYADKCTTPTLFIHSEEDYRCPISEGVQMFTALKYNGVPARICMFKGENHELSRSGKPKNRINRLTEITNWFEKYLK